MILTLGTEMVFTSVPSTKLHTMTWFSCMTRWRFPFSRYNNSIGGHSQFFCSWQDFAKLVPYKINMELAISLNFKLGVENKYDIYFSFEPAFAICDPMFDLFISPALELEDSWRWIWCQDGRDGSRRVWRGEEKLLTTPPASQLMHLQVFPISISITNVTWVALFLLFHYTMEWWSPLSIMLGKVSHMPGHLAHPAGLAWCLTQT